MSDCKYLIERANLHYVRKQASEFLCDLDKRVDTLELAPQGGVTFDYLYTTSLTGDPTVGYLGFDTLDITTVTECRVSKTTLNGNDISAFVMDLRANDVLVVFETVAPNESAVVKVTGNAVDNGTYYTIPVTDAGTTGAALPTLQDNPVDFTILYTRIIDHNDLENRDAADCHPMSAITGLIADQDRQDQELVDHENNPDAHHPHIHKLYGVDAVGSNTHEDVDVTDPIEMRDLLAYNISNNLFNPETRMNWRDAWSPLTYYVHDVVFDAGWTMVANKTTTDRAAPQTVGDPTYALPDAPAWTTFQDLSVVYSGHLYTFTSSGYFRSLRVWIPELTPETNYAIVIVRNPNSSNPTLSRINDPILNENEWTVITADTVLVFAGEELLVYIDSLNSGGEVSPGGTPADWIRQTSSNTTVPTSGGWNTNVQETLLRIHQNDADGNPIDMTGVITGSTFQFVDDNDPNTSVTYLAQSAETLAGGVYSWTVTIDSIGTNGAPAVTSRCLTTIIVPVAASTKFVGIDSYWGVGTLPTWAGIQSFLEFNGVPQPVQGDEAYGIDISFQELVTSPDWDFLSVPSGGGGGGGDFTPDVFEGAGTTGYVPDPVTETNRMLRDDGTWDFVDYSDIQNPPVGGTLWSGTLGGDIWNANSGDVGIGTTSPNAKAQVVIAKAVTQSSLASNYNLVLSNTLNTGSAGAIGNMLGFSGVQDPSFAYAAIGTPNDSGSWRMPSVAFYVNSTGSTGGDLVEAVRIQGNTGNVGIGTTAPAHLLTVGSASVVGNNQIRLAREASSEGTIGIAFDDNNVDLRMRVATDESAHIEWDGWATPQNESLKFTSINNGTHMTITSTGNVGIGTTSPATPVHIDTTNDSGSTGIRIRNTVNSNNRVDMGVAGVGYSGVGLWQNAFNMESSTGVNFTISAYNGGDIKFGTNLRNERMRITSAGNVGIGSTAPTYPLVVSNAGGAGYEVAPSTASNWVRRINYNRNTGAYVSNVHDASEHRWRIITSEKMRITSGGNVGIGTTTPQGLLTVSQPNASTMGGESDLRLFTTDDVTWDAANALNDFQYTSEAQEFVIENTTEIGAGSWSGIVFNAGYRTTGAGVGTARIAAVRTGDTDTRADLVFGTRGDNPYEKMRLTSAGRLGIGTNAPLNKLHIASGAIRQDDSTGQLMLDPVYTRHALLTNVAMYSTNTSVITGTLVVVCGGVYASSTMCNLRIRISRNYNPEVYVDVNGYISTGALWGQSDARCSAWSIVEKVEMGVTPDGRPAIFITPKLDWRNYIEVVVEHATLGWTGADNEDHRNPDNWETRHVTDLTGYDVQVLTESRTYVSGSDIYGTQFLIGGSEKMKLDTAGKLLVGYTAGTSLTNEKVRVNGNVNLGNGFNYYIDGIPISSFIDAPADGNIYGRKDNAWTSLGSGTGTVSDLSLSRTSVTNTILNTGGDNVTILEASNTLAGVMTAAQKVKLDTVEEDANNYIHPAYTARASNDDTGTLSGATVISRALGSVTNDAIGSVTFSGFDFQTRELTPADIGAVAEGDVPSIAAGIWTPTLTTAIGSYSAEGSWVTLGNLVMLYGRITANANLSGSSQCRIGGLPFQCDLINTGCAMGYQYISNRNSDGNGFEMVLNTGSSQIDIYGIGGSGGSEHMRGQDISAGAHIQINIMYYSNAAG